MADRFQTRECSIDQLQPELILLARQYILGGDQILCCYEHKFERSAGIFGLGVRIYFESDICTQTRVIHVGRGYDEYTHKIRDDANTMELSDVMSAREFQTEFGYRVALTERGSNGMTLTFQSLQASSKFATVLRNAIANSKIPTPSVSNSIEARIRSLKQLRQDGLITEAQFQQKLQEIVNQL